MPAPIATATGSGQGVATVAVTVPAATAVGELILIRFATNASTTITTPAGYAVVQDGQSSPQTSGLLVSKVAAGGDAGSSVSVTFGASSRVSAICATYPAGSTVNAHGGANVATSSTTFTSPAVTTTEANCTILLWDVEQATGNTVTFTGPAGFATAAQVASLAGSGNNNKQGLAWSDVGAAGSYGPYAATWDVAGTGRANTVAIAPPPSGVATATSTMPATVGLSGSASSVLTATASMPLGVGMGAAASALLTATVAMPATVGMGAAASPMLTGGASLPVGVGLTATATTVTPAPPASYRDLVLSHSPALYLELDDTSGTTAVDSSGNGRNGTYVNGYALSQPSLLGSGFGTSVSRTVGSSRIEIPAGAWSTPTTGLTATALVNLTSFNTLNAIFARDEAAGGGDRQFVLYVNDSGGFRFIGSTQTVTDYDSISAAGLVALNRTYHVAMAWDVSAGSVSVYLDGALAHTFTGFTGAARTSTALAWSFGNITGANSSLGWGVSGRYDDVAAFMSVLSASNIASLAAASAGNAPPPAPAQATATLPLSVGLTAAASSVAQATSTLPLTVGLAASGALVGGGGGEVGGGTTTATLPFTVDMSVTASSPAVTPSSTATLGLSITLSAMAVVTTTPSDPGPEDPPPAPEVESNLQVGVATSVLETPAWLDLSVSNASVESSLEFFVDGELVYDVISDDAGQAVGMSVPLGLLAAGTHDVRVHDVATGRSTTVNFEVRLDPASVPAVAPAPAPPTPPQVVNRWSFEQPGGEVLMFPTNPARMSNPHAARVFTTEHTTSRSGQPLTFEGEPVAVEWNVEGTCLTQEFYEALERFQALSQRFYAVDHLDRVWVVTFEALDWTQLRDRRYPWGHTYRAKLLIYAGPLEG